MNITWFGSPNFDGNRLPITRIVLHWMDGTLAGTDAQFQKPKGTSAHFGIEDDTVHQYVNVTQVAYHAGSYPMNQRSIGIEHSADPNRPASEKTYETSAQVIATMCKAYNIPVDREHIIKHSEVIPTQCPGSLGIDRIIQRVLQINSIPMLPTELQKYSLKWKELAINKGFDVNSAQFADYRNIDKILSDKLKSLTEGKDKQINELQEIGKSLTAERDSLRTQLAQTQAQLLNDDYTKLGHTITDLVKKAVTL